MSKVYFIPSESAEQADITDKKLSLLFQKAGLGRVFRKNDVSALKVHVGEPGTQTYIKPHVVRALVALMRSSGVTPFLTDSAVLYKSARQNGVGHTQTAIEHGFGLFDVGAPFIPADGILGKDAVSLPVFGKHFEEVAIASAIVQARSMLVLSHATGHLGVGFGGALKNLGMGCSAKKAKLGQHNGQQPKIKVRACTACGVCADNCPSDAITVDDHAAIDSDKCIGCGECIAICQEGAVVFDWSVVGQELGERIAEHAAGVFRQKRSAICFVTAAQEITKDCDCLGFEQKPLLPDIGFFASLDPVALDKAVYDAIVERSGQTLESMSYPNLDGARQFHYAEKLGLGSTKYERIDIGL
jgi:uncharacterized protein